MVEAPWAPRRPPVWVRRASLYVALAVISLAPHAAPIFSPDSPLTLVLVLAPLALLPWRRRLPWVVLGACLALFGTAAVFDTVSPGIAGACAVVVFQIALTNDHRTSLLTGWGTAVTILVLCLPAKGVSLLDPAALMQSVVMLLAAAAGEGTRLRREHLAAVTERAERAERTREEQARRAVTEERLRIARDLHDTVAHEIAIISLNAGVATSALDKRPERAREALGTIRTASRNVLGEIGDLMTMLRTNDDPAGGDFHPRPQPGAGQLGDLIAEFRSSGLTLDARIVGDLDRLSGSVSAVAYRVLQESLTNAHKHGTGSATVSITVDPHDLQITVTNPVRTVPTREVAGTGMGLIGMRERVASVRGTLSTGVGDRGWTVTASVPLPPPAASLGIGSGAGG